MLEPRMFRFSNFGPILNKQDLQNYDKSSTHINAMGDVTIVLNGNIKHKNAFN
jgi:hypothetical protein